MYLKMGNYFLPILYIFYINFLLPAKLKLELLMREWVQSILPFRTVERNYFGSPRHERAVPNQYGPKLSNRSSIAGVFGVREEGIRFGWSLLPLPFTANIECTEHCSRVSGPNIELSNHKAHPWNDRASSNKDRSSLLGMLRTSYYIIYKLFTLFHWNK